MKKKLLILSLYPVPYRSELFKLLSEKYDTKVFYAKSSGDQRNKEYFTEHSQDIFIDTDEGSKQFNEELKNLKAYDFVAVYEYSTMPGCRLIAECKLKKVPYMINCDGVILEKHGNFAKDLFKRVLLQGADAYVASGSHAKQYLLKYGAREERIYIHGFTALTEDDILNEPVSRENKLSIRKKLGLPENVKTAIAVGRFIPLKRYDVLINWWKQMKSDEYLLLIGGGPEADNYKKIIADNSLTNVIVEGFHSKEELKEYYRASDVFVHPTSYDVWGLVINEAMANGLPVVCSDTCVAGLELIENGKNGFVVSMEDEQGFISAVREIFDKEDSAFRISAEAIETIKPFTIKQMADKHIEVIEKTISNKR